MTNESNENGEQAEQTKRDTSIRVQVSLLDSLMNLAGELVLSRNQLLQTISSTDYHNVGVVGQRIDMITSELQEAIMLTRMQPIGNVFGKFPRLVRELANVSGKAVDLEIIGKDVELDKTILEAISVPLSQLINNAVAHGIELPADRRKKGKTGSGRVVLKAFHEAGQVLIEISDDGKGLDGEFLAVSGVTKGLLSMEQAQAMSEKEKINLIFLPGFSTGEKGTDLSGRGTGMDLVKTELDKLGGSIAVSSEPDCGTTISIKLPLTLAIIPCQIILAGDERYAIPQVNLEELLRIPAHQVKERIECVGDAEVVRLRGKLLPLVRLADVIGIERTYSDPIDGERKADRRQRIADRRSRVWPVVASGPQEIQINRSKDSGEMESRSISDRRQSPKSALHIVVVSTGTMRYGLVVDRLLDSEEIVSKPLGLHLQGCKGYAGATTMGDGRIALILDVGNLARMAQLVSLDESARASDVAINAAAMLREKNERQSLLVFHSSEEERFGVSLAQVDRIEKIRQAQIEHLGGKRVMQYRGGSLPLICINDVATVQPVVDREELLVIVFNYGANTVGLLATGPIDAVDVNVNMDTVTLQQSGIQGSAIINGQTTMLVNIPELIENIFPEWFDDGLVA